MHRMSFLQRRTTQSKQWRPQVQSDDTEFAGDQRDLLSSSLDSRHCQWISIHLPVHLSWLSVMTLSSSLCAHHFCAGDRGGASKGDASPETDPCQGCSSLYSLAISLSFPACRAFVCLCLVKFICWTALHLHTSHPNTSNTIDNTDLHTLFYFCI